MKKIIGNKLFLAILILILFSCKLQTNSFRKNEKNAILGTWYQKHVILFNEPIYMAASNEWNFEVKKCRVLLGEPTKYEYEYKLFDNYLELYPINGNKYAEWENVLFFNRKIMLEGNDTIMIWNIPDTLQINFQRNL